MLEVDVTCGYCGIEDEPKEEEWVFCECPHSRRHCGIMVRHDIAPPGERRCSSCVFADPPRSQGCWCDCGRCRRPLRTATGGGAVVTPLLVLLLLLACGVVLGRASPLPTAALWEGTRATRFLKLTWPQQVPSGWRGARSELSGRAAPVYVWGQRRRRTTRPKPCTRRRASKAGAKAAGVGQAAVDNPGSLLWRPAGLRTWPGLRCGWPFTGRRSELEDGGSRRLKRDEARNVTRGTCIVKRGSAVREREREQLSGAKRGLAERELAKPFWLMRCEGLGGSVEMRSGASPGDGDGLWCEAGLCSTKSMT